MLRSWGSPQEGTEPGWRGCAGQQAACNPRRGRGLESCSMERNSTHKDTEMWRSTLFGEHRFCWCGEMVGAQVTERMGPNHTVFSASQGSWTVCEGSGEILKGLVGKYGPSWEVLCLRFKNHQIAVWKIHYRKDERTTNWKAMEVLVESSRHCLGYSGSYRTLSGIENSWGLLFFVSCWISVISTFP